MTINTIIVTNHMVHTLTIRLQSHAATGREGLLWFLSFLPSTLGEGFAIYISITLPVILSGDGVDD